MEKNVMLLVLFALISGYESQIVIADVSGPTVIRNVHSFNENGTSVVNVVHGYGTDDTSIFSSGTNGPVVIKGVTSTVIDGSTRNGTGVWLVSGTTTTQTGNHRQKGNRAHGLFEGSCWHLMLIYTFTQTFLKKLL